MNTFINNIKFVLGLLAVVCFAGIAPTPVQAETTQCTVITSLPYTITTQGVYCLKGNLATNMTTGHAITINTNNVTIDLNGYKIGGLAAGAGTDAVGIYAYQRKNITIKNGIVRGFISGIWLADSSPYTASEGNSIEDIRADLNTNTGIEIEGSGNTVRNCHVVSTGGSTLGTDAFGILANGPGTVISNNTVTDTVEQSGGSSDGIDVQNGSGSLVGGNDVTNAAIGPGTSFGIEVLTAHTSVLNNNIVNETYGVYFLSPATGIYRDNLVSGATTAYTNGTAAGTTNYSIP